VILCHCPETSATVYSYSWWYCAIVLKHNTQAIHTAGDTVPLYWNISQTKFRTTWIQWKTCLKNISFSISHPCDVKNYWQRKVQWHFYLTKLWQLNMSSLLTSLFTDTPSFSWPVHGNVVFSGVG
jgi:hypothetical protein